MSRARTIILDLPTELGRVFPLMHATRKHLDLAEFTRLVMLAQAADGYRLIAREFEGRIQAVMGYRILHDLTHGSHLYVDDLAFVSPDTESRAELLLFAESEARRLGLAGLRLSAETNDQQLKRYFEDEGWEGATTTFKKRVASH